MRTLLRSSFLTLLAVVWGCSVRAGSSPAIKVVRPASETVAAPSQETDKELRQVGTIPLPGVEGRFDHFAADLKTYRLFVAALGNETLEVLDVEVDKKIASVPLQREPQGVAFAPELNRLYVGNGGAGECDVLDGKSLRLLQRVTGFEDADNVRYEPRTRRVFVGYGGAVAFFGTDADHQMGEVRLSGHPESFQLERQGSRIFINVPSARQVVVADRATGKIVARWALQGARSNFPMALDEAHHRLFVGCRNPARLLVYDTETGRQVARADIVGDTDDLFYDAARKWLYVSGGEGFINVLEQTDPNHYRPLARIPTAEGARTSLFVPEWNRLFVAVPHRGAQAAEIRVYEPLPRLESVID